MKKIYIKKITSLTEALKLYKQGFRLVKEAMDLEYITNLETLKQEYKLKNITDDEVLYDKFEEIVLNSDPEDILEEYPELIKNGQIDVENLASNMFKIVGDWTKELSHDTNESQKIKKIYEWDEDDEDDDGRRQDDEEEDNGGEWNGEMFDRDSNDIQSLLDGINNLSQLKDNITCFNDDELVTDKFKEIVLNSDPEDILEEYPELCITKIDKENIDSKVNTIIQNWQSLYNSDSNDDLDYEIILDMIKKVKSLDELKTLFEKGIIGENEIELVTDKFKEIVLNSDPKDILEEYPELCITKIDKENLIANIDRIIRKWDEERVSHHELTDKEKKEYKKNGIKAPDDEQQIQSQIIYKKDDSIDDLIKTPQDLIFISQKLVTNQNQISDEKKQKFHEIIETKLKEFIKDYVEVDMANNNVDATRINYDYISEIFKFLYPNIQKTINPEDNDGLIEKVDQYKTELTTADKKELTDERDMLLIDVLYDQWILSDIFKYSSNQVGQYLLDEYGKEKLLTLIKKK